MRDLFILKEAEEVFETVNNNYFKRYDLSYEYSQLSRKINESKKKIGRGPFMYELLDYLLMKIEANMKERVKNVLYGKDNEWFFKVGQYFLYNTFQWMKSLDYTPNLAIEDQFLIEFLEKWWNKFLVLENCGIKKSYSFPKKILLELTNNCNLNCIMCGIGKNGYDSSKNLSLDLLYSLSEKIFPEVDLIRLNGLGESTILPNFLEYLNIISESPAQLEIVTNLTQTNNKIWEKLIRYNTNFLISCDSSSAYLFESIRRGANFKNFLANLRYIGKNISDPLQGQIIFTLMECNIREISNVVKLAANMGLGGVIVNVVKTNSNKNNWMLQNYEEIIKEFQKAYQLAESNNLALKLPDHIEHLSINKSISNPSCQFHCNNPWEEVYIRYNGDLTVCNMLNPYIYGNCQNYSFEKIWNGLNAELFRNFVNTKYRHYYCKDCYYLV